MRRPVALLAVCLLAASNGVAGTGSAAHGRAMTTDSAALVPADRRYQFVDVGGYRLRLLCMGTGRPTVVLEAGEGEGLATWGPVQIGLRRVTRVCAYDRAGEGKSDQGPLPRTSRRVAGEMHTLLRRAGVTGPYVLVGQSIGGMYVRLYTYTYPRDVVGMVLVDSAHEDRFAPRYAVLRRVFALPSRCGPRATECEEIRAWPQDAAEARAARRGHGTTPLGHIPLIVLTPAHHTYRGLTTAQEKHVEAIEQSLQRSLVGLSSNSIQVMVPASRQAIQRAHPSTVIAAIREVVDTIHHHRPLI